MTKIIGLWEKHQLVAGRPDGHIKSLAKPVEQVAKIDKKNGFLRTFSYLIPTSQELA